MTRLLSPLALLPLALAWATQAGPERRTTRLHFTPGDRETARYQYVPFDVGEGTTRLTVEYRYDRANGTNVVDLGLYEPGPLDLGRASSRGWSGGERSLVTITPSAATPGYWPGPLPAGRWHVLLGLYKVAEGGVDVELVVETAREPAGPPATPAPRRAEPLRAGPAWYSGGLHMHTVHSDGTLGVAELARAARAAGLDFIAITDHNNTAHQAEAVPPDAPLLIVGEEVTTPGGHASVWGLSGREAIDFRVLPGDGRIGELVAAARREGTLFSINHPRSSCLGCSWEHAIPPGVTGIEISSVRHEEQQAAIALWDSLLREGRRMTAVGTSDWHRAPHPIGSAAVRVWARELSTPAMLEALREGRVIVMADATTPAPELTVRSGRRLARVGDTLALKTPATLDVKVSWPAVGEGRAELLWNGDPTGTASLRSGGPARFSHRASSSGYLRVHLYDGGGTLRAITNPVYVTVGP